MNKFSKKLISLLMVCIMVCLLAAPMSASAVNYPQNVTPSQAENAIDNTDQLINGLMKNFADTSLKDMAMPEIYSGGLLSLLLTEVYKALEKNADAISALGLDVSVSNVAYYLSNYSQVSSKLRNYSSWEQVDLTGVSWGVTDKQSFAVAASAMFGPLNSLLYTLLCGGAYPVVGALVSIQGEAGYENAIVPIYNTLGLDTYTSSASFCSLAASDKYSMIYCIVSDLLGFVEDVLEAPAQKLTENLPSIAYFITSGALEKTISKLLEPLKVTVLGVPILAVDSFVDLSAIEGGLDINIDMGSSSGKDLQLAPIDLEVFAACGTVEGDRVNPNKGDVFIEFLRWAIETIKLNQSTISELLAESEVDLSQYNIDINTLVSELLSKPTDEIISILVNILAGDGAVINNYMWSFNRKAENTAVYTENLNRDHFVRAVSEIDDIVNQLVKESGEAESLRELLSPMLYSNSLVTQLVSGLYGFLQGEDIEKFVSLLNIDLSPAAVSKILTDAQFSEASATLANLSSWEYLNEDSVSWGFTDGDKDAFLNAVSVVLSPADELLSMLLAGDKITLFESLDFYGSDGYNTAVIPLLEAIGIYYDDIPGYNEYVKQIETQGAIRPILDSLSTLVERFFEKPVYTVTEILPNLMYFLNNSGLDICATNLLYPIMYKLDQLGLSSLIDFSQFTKIDVNALLSTLVSNAGITFAFPALNLSQFEGMGELVTVDSKRTQGGSQIKIYAVSADQPAVMVTLLRFAVETLKTPGNESFILDLLGSDEELSSNSIITALAQGVSDKIGNMTVDEALEWVYDVFFFERVTVDLETEDDNYAPQVAYTEKNGFPSGIVLTILLIILMLSAIIALTNRDKIKIFLQDYKQKKAAKK